MIPPIFGEAEQIQALTATSTSIHRSCRLPQALSCLRDRKKGDAYRNRSKVHEDYI